MNKKLMLFMNTCMLQFSSAAGGYFSSAQILETGLAKVGIKFPKKLWFQYKLPDGISPEKFELEMEKIIFFAFEYPTIKGIVEIGCVDRDGLSDEELDIVQKYRVSQRLKYLEILDKHVKWVKENNPELSNVNIQDNEVAKSGFLRGVLYGFGPEEISYFITRSFDEAESDSVEIDKLAESLQKIGVQLTYILSPNNRLLLEKELEKYFMKQKQFEGKE